MYEVERIEQSRKTGKRTEYLIKWLDWDESTNTWESASRIHPALVAAFEGKPAPQPRISAPALPKRGAGAARARLSGAEQRRGPTLTLTFFVLTMDKTGHIVWPTNFEARTRAALRMQARALLQRMIDDPLNPVDSTMAPALTAEGTSAVWKGAPWSSSGGRRRTWRRSSSRSRPSLPGRRMLGLGVGATPRRKPPRIWGRYWRTLAYGAGTPRCRRAWPRTRTRTRGAAERSAHGCRA